MLDINELIKVMNDERVMSILNGIAQGKSLEDVRNSISKSTFYRLLDRLESLQILKLERDKICFTSIGYACYRAFEKFKKSLITLEKIVSNFPNHRITFPDDFFLRLHEIEDFEVMTSSKSDLLKPHRTFIKLLRDSRDIMGLASVYYHDYPQVLEEIAENVNSLSLILTKDVAEEVFKSETLAIMKRCNAELYVIDHNPYIAFTVTDRFLSIGFFYNSSEAYDFTRDLISTSPSAMRFGRDLFEHYLSHSKKIDF
jgi:predicted transcriptional regulator